MSRSISFGLNAGCKGLCSVYSVCASHNNRYEHGLKYCARCARYFDSTDIFCPCCGRHMRSRPKDRGRKK